MPILVKIGQKMCLWQQHEIWQKQGVCVKTGVRSTYIRELASSRGSDPRARITAPRARRARGSAKSASPRARRARRVSAREVSLPAYTICFCQFRAKSRFSGSDKAILGLDLRNENLHEP